MKKEEEEEEEKKIVHDDLVISCPTQIKLVVRFRLQLDPYPL